MAELATGYEAVAGELGLPDREGAAAYFVVKTALPTNLVLSLKRATWAAPVAAGDAVSAAVAAGAQVFLLFSVVSSRHFQGVARVRAAPIPGNAPSECYIPCEWLRACALPFAAVAAVRNDADGGAPAARARDWASLPPAAGRALMLHLYRSPEIVIATDGVPDDATFDVLHSETPAGAALLDGEDFGEELATVDRSEECSGGGGGGGMGGGGVDEHGLPPMLFMAALPGMPAVSPLVEMLLAGTAPPDAQPAAHIAADAFTRGTAGYMFGTNNFMMPASLRCGVLVGPEEHAPRLRSVAPGTPAFLFNSNQGIVMGAFLARTPAIHRLVPSSTFPPLVVKSGDATGRVMQFSWHTQVLCVIELPSMPSDVAEGILGSRINPGPLTPAQVHALATAMFSAVPAHAALRTAGMLQQMAALGMPQDDLLSPPMP